MYNAIIIWVWSHNSQVKNAVIFFLISKLNCSCLPFFFQELNKVVVIEGVPYKTSSNKLRKAKSSAKKQRKGKMASLSKSRKIGELRLMENIYFFAS